MRRDRARDSGNIMARPRRGRETGFDFAAEVEGIGIGIYEFVGRVALTTRLSIFCPRRFRLFYLKDLRGQDGVKRRVAREIPYFLFAYGLTIMLVFLIDTIFIKALGEEEQGLAQQFPILNAVSGKLLELDVFAWAFVIIPVLVGLHYGILIFDWIVRRRTPGTRQTIYDPGSLMIYYVANNILVPTAAVILFILSWPAIDRHIGDQAQMTGLTVFMALIMLLVLAVQLLVPFLLLMNTISFIRTMSSIYGVGRLLFIGKALLATIPLGIIALTLFVMIEAIFALLNAPLPPAA